MRMQRKRSFGITTAILVAATAVTVSNGIMSAQAGSINTAQPFTGTAATNWGWESKTDPTIQLSGTNQMTYTNAATNGSSCVTNSITDAATVFPNGTGTIKINFTVDFSNYLNAETYVAGPTLAEISMNAGNQGAFPPWASGGAMATVGLTGPWMATGAFGIISSANGAYGAGSGGSSPLAAISSANPVFNFTWTVNVAGSAATAWTVTSDVSATNVPFGGSTTLVAPTSTLTDTTFSSGWSGLGSAVAYKVGDNGANNGGPPTVGQSITFSSFSANAVTIPEPASLGLGLLGLGIIALGRRRMTRQSV